MTPGGPPPLHELEGQVMEEVWRLGRASVRDVLDALNKREAKHRAYTTVMTIMTRLDEKGLLRRERQGRADMYEAVLSREDYQQARAHAEVGALVEEFGDHALVHFARQMHRLDPERRRRLQRLARRD